MNRRRFISLSVTGAAAASLPFSQCGDGDRLPKSLRSILSKAQIKDIGKAYTQQFPAEKDTKKLSDLIRMNVDPSAEFQNKKTVIVNGWILSLTEARESALYFLNS